MKKLYKLQLIKSAIFLFALLPGYIWYMEMLDIEKAEKLVPLPYAFLMGYAIGAISWMCVGSCLSKLDIEVK